MDPMVIFLLYLVSCIYYAFHIRVTSDGISSVNLGGLQADLNGGSGGAEPPSGKKDNTFGGSC